MWVSTIKIYTLKIPYPVREDNPIIGYKVYHRGIGLESLIGLDFHYEGRYYACPPY